MLAQEQPIRSQKAFDADETFAKRLAELVAEARGRYNVRVFGRNLPFNYQGFYSDGPQAPPG